MNRSRTAMYTPRETLEFEEAIAWHARSAKIDFGEAKVRVVCEFYMPDKKKVDGDNILKSVLDGLVTGAAFKDDSQVMQAMFTMHPNSSNPRTVVEIDGWLMGGHAIFCGGTIVKVVKRADHLECDKCGQEVTSWLVT